MLFLYFIANFIHRFAVAPDCCWQLTCASSSLHRPRWLIASARARSRSPTASVYSQTGRGT